MLRRDARRLDVLLAAGRFDSLVEVDVASFVGSGERTQLVDELVGEQGGA
jgi:hypothetical protein